MVKVLVFGTFDIFHDGHRSFLNQAKAHGVFLRVVVARDATVAQVKNRAVENDENKRKKEIEESGLADEVVLGSLEDKFAVIGQYRPDVICLGYDQEVFVDKLENKLKEFGLEKTKIIRMRPYYPEKYKSSLLRESLGK